MIERLQILARKLTCLRIPCMFIGILSLGCVVLTALLSNSHEGDRYLIPGILGLLWSASIFSLIVVFRYTPTLSAYSSSLWGRFKGRLYRSWYWILSVVFLVLSLVNVSLTIRMLKMWFSEYGV